MRWREITEAHHAYDDINVFDTKFQPLKAGDTVRVFHGFRDLPDAIMACRYGLSGKTRAARVYSYESDNNPHGLFVTLNFKTAAEFGGTIIEFVARSEELEAPVWPGGSYTVQGQMSQYFGHGAKGRAARHARRRAARDEVSRDFAGRPDPDNWRHVTDSDDVLTANVLLNSHEFQALFIGDLNPGRIAAVYTRDHNTVNSTWTKHSVTDFVAASQEPKWSPERNQGDRFFKPEDKFDGERFLAAINAKYGGRNGKDMEETVRGIWFMCLESQHKAQAFVRDFGAFLWPNQYRDAMLWMRHRWGVRPVSESINFEPYSGGHYIANPRPMGSLGPARLYPPILAEQAVSRSVMLSALRSLTSQINSHLITLLAFEPSETVEHWRGEVQGFIREVQNLRSTKGNRPVPAKMYLQCLWEEPFGGNEVGYVETWIEDTAQKKPRLKRNDLSVDQIVVALRQWHETMGAAIEEGRDVSPLIAAVGPQKPSFTKRPRRERKG